MTGRAGLVAGIAIALSAMLVVGVSSAAPRVTQKPLVWFAPLPGNVTPHGGSKDFMALFTRKARWAKAARHVRIFKLYEGWILDDANVSRLRAIVADLRRRKIALAVEVGALPDDTCGAGVEGFVGREGMPAMARRIKAVGGTVKYVAFDEPFAFGSLYDGPNACRWPPEKVAEEVGAFVHGLRAYFPKVVAGDIEPLWSGLDPAVFESWMDTYQRVTGTRLPFFHLDVDFDRPGWTQEAHRLEDAARSRGIAFGFIYYGGYGRQTDAEWTGAAERRFVEYEAKEGIRPDQVIFQSWEDRPDRALPESRHGTFTWLINRYFRTRTNLTLQVAGLAAFGRLTDAKAQSLYGRSVELTATPLDGAGAYAEYTLTGTVPAGAVTADVGYRVNTECGCSGPADFTLYESRYRESGSPNRVPNPRFDAGLAGWGTWGDGEARLEPSDRGGQALHVTAGSGQVAAINSAAFPVDARARFTVAFAARVSPASVGSGYFDLVFLGPEQEVARTTVGFAAASIALGRRTTSRLGRFSAPLGSLPAGSYLVEAWFRGGSSLFPSYSAIRLAR